MKNIRRKKVSSKDKVGSKSELDSLITQRQEHVSTSTYTSQTSSNFFFSADGDSLKAYDEAENSLLEDFSNQFSPLYWIELDIKYCKDLLSRLFPNDEIANDIENSHMFILFEGESKARIKPQHMAKAEFIKSVNKKWFQSESMNHMRYIKSTYPEHRIANYTAEAAWRLRELKLIMQGVSMAGVDPLRDTFIHTRRVGELRQLIQLKQHEVAILTRSTSGENLNYRNRASISLSEENKIVEQVTAWYSSTEPKKPLKHPDLFEKIIKELFEVGDLPDEYINDMGIETTRDSSMSDPANQRRLAKSLGQKHPKKSFFKKN